MSYMTCIFHMMSKDHVPYFSLYRESRVERLTSPPRSVQMKRKSPPPPPQFPILKFLNSQFSTRKLCLTCGVGTLFLILATSESSEIPKFPVSTILYMYLHNCLYTFYSVFSKLSERKPCTSVIRSMI